MEVDKIISEVFGKEFLTPSHEILDESSPSTSNSKTYLSYLPYHINGTLAHITEETEHRLIKQGIVQGRIGPSKAKFNPQTYVGHFISGTDFLSLNSQNNFSSVLANVCVFKDKWQYELQLGSKGVMQLGWATKDCKFSQEKGVGDTPFSYAYDGNRLRKWNLQTFKYGESWLSGDIIGCTINLDEGVIEFFRNGRSLGVAFDDVKTGPGLAYFPAVSLALSENLVGNFGATPFRYPVPNFQPLEDVPKTLLNKAIVLFRWLEKLIPLFASRSNSQISQSSHQSVPSQKDNLTIIASHVFQALSPLLQCPFVTEACLVPLVEDLVSLDSRGRYGYKHLMTLMDLLWGFLEPHELKLCLDSLLTCMTAVYRLAPSDLEFHHQKVSLRCLLGLVSHTRTRRHLLMYVLFDKFRFPSFVHLKPLDERGLSAAITSVWWESTKYHIPYKDKIEYDSACQNIKKAVDEMEELQVEFLCCLMNNKDGSDSEPSSRMIFLNKFRLFLGENSVAASVLHTPLPVTLCCFHRLFSIVLELWEEEIGCNEPICIPTKVFYDSSISYFERERVGGVFSHIRKAFREDVNVSLGLPKEHDSTATNHNIVVTVLTDIEHVVAVAENVSTINVDPLNSSVSANLRPNLFNKTIPGCDTKQTLIELMDSIVFLYHLAAHKQLAKVSTLRENMNDYIKALEETEEKLAAGEKLNYPPEVLAALKHSRTVFIEKLSEQSRQMAWVIAVVYSPEKQQQIATLLMVVLSTVKRASEEGVLFSFVPDFYIDALISSCNALKTYFDPVTPIENIRGYESLLTDVASFLATHFADSRVVNPDTRDSLIQALSNFALYSITLRALERIPEKDQRVMIHALIRPYENRPWAQSNWILVRLWQGSGFSYRYTKPPHLQRQWSARPTQTDSSSFAQTVEPCPSPQLQHLLGSVLLIDEYNAVSFLNSLLNQLNWAFSEFIGMLQEIQNVCNRPDRVFIESRQLKICATCFDLSLALLRVLEMVVYVARPLFVDKSRASSELLLSRLCQLLAQVLNRVGNQPGCFSQVVSMDIPGLESVDYYPILTAISGITVGLILPEVDLDEQGIATAALVSEPSFQISSLDFAIDSQAIAGAHAIQKGFAFQDYPNDVSSTEITNMHRVAVHLECWQKKISASKTSLPEDEICTICYAFQRNSVFSPCGHQSCRSCISHHLMNQLECFFCKIKIQHVADRATGKVYEDLNRQIERLKQEKEIQERLQEALRPRQQPPQ